MVADNQVFFNQHFQPSLFLLRQHCPWALEWTKGPQITPGPRTSQPRGERGASITPHVLMTPVSFAIRSYQGSEKPLSSTAFSPDSRDIPIKRQGAVPVFVKRAAGGSHRDGPNSQRLQGVGVFSLKNTTSCTLAAFIGMYLAFSHCNGVKPTSPTTKI